MLCYTHIGVIVWVNLGVSVGLRVSSTQTGVSVWVRFVVSVGLGLVALILGLVFGYGLG